MIVDRVARAMTEGAPRAGFTARVMAPIHGRPQPGFTARVMANLDAPRARATGWGLRPAVIAACAVAIVAGAVLLRPAELAMPTAPDAPRIAARPYDRELIGIPPLPYNRWAPVTRGARGAGRRQLLESPAPQVADALLEARPIHVIDKLAVPAEIALGAIKPPAFTTPPLAEPTRLIVADLRFKERP